MSGTYLDATYQNVIFENPFSTKPSETKHDDGNSDFMWAKYSGDTSFTDANKDKNGSWVIFFDKHSHALDTAWKAVLATIDAGELLKASVLKCTDRFQVQRINIYTPDYSNNPCLYDTLRTISRYRIDKDAKNAQQLIYLTDATVNAGVDRPTPKYSYTAQTIIENAARKAEHRRLSLERERPASIKLSGHERKRPTGIMLFGHMSNHQKRLLAVGLLLAAATLLIATAAVACAASGGSIPLVSAAVALMMSNTLSTIISSVVTGLAGMLSLGLAGTGGLAFAQSRRSLK